MHILMKFLKIKLSLFFYLLVLIQASDINSSLDCIYLWKANNISQDTSKVLNIKASVLFKDQSLDSIDIFLDKYNKKLKINFNNQIFMLDEYKSIRIFKNTNQLYVDNPDSDLYNLILSIFTDFNSQDFYKSSVKFVDDKDSYQKYIINNYYSFKQIILAYKSDCSVIKYIHLKSDELDMHIDNIDFRFIQNDNFFQINNDYFKFDLRNEN